LSPTLESVNQINKQVRRLERLVNDLLDASRVKTGKLDLRLEANDLVELVCRVVEEQRASSGRTISIHMLASQPQLVVGDAERLMQVLTNYLTNALKYSPLDTLVDVGLERELQEVRVWVRDVGPGIPSQEQERIWDRFHRASGIKVQSGTGIGLGLGLTISREIIELHHGHVGVQSTPGAGSTFWFTLPLA
jgi:signal transduction histidine kinase